MKTRSPKTLMKNALIVDDHPSVRLALRYTLEKMGFSHMDECDNGVDAIRLIKKNSYQIIILDIGIPAMDGMSVISTVRKTENHAHILVFTSQSQDIYAARSIAVGASGFVSKNHDMDTVASAVKAILSGFNFFPYTPVVPNTENQLGKLSNRELDVLRKLASGMTNNEIANNMCLSNKTISTYKTRLMEKLGVSTLADLITIARGEHLP